MTRTLHNTGKPTCSAHTVWTRHSLEEKFEKLDREADHDYVPMDLFIDPRTMQEHFQESAVRARVTGTL